VALKDTSCPSCSGLLVEIERSGVRIDACRDCRGVWLDRGELDRIIELERRAVDADEDDFVREMTGQVKPGEPRGEQKGFGLDARTAERIYKEYRAHKQHKPRKKKTLLDELFG
jgi:uncharacterized protein